MLATLNCFYLFAFWFCYYYYFVLFFDFVFVYNVVWLEVNSRFLFLFVFILQFFVNHRVFEYMDGIYMTYTRSIPFDSNHKHQMFMYTIFVCFVLIFICRLPFAIISNFIFIIFCFALKQITV